MAEQKQAQAEALAANAAVGGVPEADVEQMKMKIARRRCELLLQMEKNDCEWNLKKTAKVMKIVELKDKLEGVLNDPIRRSLVEHELDTVKNQLEAVNTFYFNLREKGQQEDKELEISLDALNRKTHGVRTIQLCHASFGIHKLPVCKLEVILDALPTYYGQPPPNKAHKLFLENQFDNISTDYELDFALESCNSTILKLLVVEAAVPRKRKIDEISAAAEEAVGVVPPVKVPWTKYEEALLVYGVNKWGFEWSKVAAEVPSRTASQCKGKYHYMKLAHPASVVGVPSDIMILATGHAIAAAHQDVAATMRSIHENAVAAAAAAADAAEEQKQQAEE